MLFFVFIARAEKGIARHIDTSSVVWTLIDNGLVTFDWFVLSMRMQVILDQGWTLFSPARVQPLYGAGRKESSGTGLHISIKRVEQLESL